MDKVEFIQMKDGTYEEYQFLHKLEAQYILGLPERLLKSVENLGGTLQGYQISRLEHSLQSATRAEADGADKADGGGCEQCHEHETLPAQAVD